MAQWIKTDGTITEVEPANGKDFSLIEVKRFIGGGYVEVIGVRDGLMLLDEDGKRKQLPVNELATAVALPVLQRGDFIVGDVLVCKRGQIK